MSAVVTIVDYGVGNLGAIPNMLRRAGARAIVTDDPARVLEAERIILPGVGSFDVAMTNLEERGLIPALRRRALEDGVPVLGLCLGMEILGSRSEEGRLPGLGWIPGQVVRFSPDGGEDPIRVPHMGWNWVEPAYDHPLVRDLPRPARFYFAHSFYFVPDDARDALAVTTYGHLFASALARANVMGVQFHPEKSHRFGLQLLTSFAGL